MCRMRIGKTEAKEDGQCVLCAARGGSPYCDESRSKENIAAAEKLFVVRTAVSETFLDAALQ